MKEQLAQVQFVKDMFNAVMTAARVWGEFPTRVEQGEEQWVVEFPSRVAVFTWRDGKVEVEVRER